MAKVIPAILEHELSAYRKKVNLVRQLTDRFQLDVIDGELIDNKTIQPQQIEPPAGLKVDIHLMVKRPMEYIMPCVKLRPYTIIVQYEGAENVIGALEKIHKNGIRCGLAINPETSLSEVAPLLELVKHVLIMAYPAGFAGQKLQPEVFTKAHELREMKPDIEIGLDGGVAAGSLKQIAAAGFDVVNTNSFLFGAESPLSRYHELIGALALV
ncbi:MAG: hypothetical protein U0526_01380 [Candidatus Saccharibacteria bacterium]